MVDGAQSSCEEKKGMNGQQQQQRVDGQSTSWRGQPPPFPPIVVVL